MKKAVIVGDRGQDGFYLSKFLREKNYSVLGLNKDNFNIFDQNQVSKLVSHEQPDEVYFLAAYHHSSQALPASSDELMDMSFKTHVKAPGYFLSSMSGLSPQSRFFYASSSLVFEEDKSGLQNEKTQFNARSPYGVSKIEGMKLCSEYRAKGLFACSGILYNHESPRRGRDFVSRKISQAVAEIVSGKKDFIELSNLDTVVDWSHAEDVVQAMWMILQLNKPDDFIISSGKGNTVRDMVEAAFQSQNLDYKKYVRISENSLGRSSSVRVGDNSLLKNEGWLPTKDLKQIMSEMVQNDLYLLKKGER